MTLNPSYVYDGKEHVFENLFSLYPIIEEIENLLDAVSGDAREMLSLIADSTPPDIQIGDHCHTPYECPYLDHCSRDIDEPDHRIEELPSLHVGRKLQLKQERIEEIRDVPDDFPLTDLQSIVRQTVLEQKMVVHGDLPLMLSSIQPPVRYLGFETFAPAIPRFVGTSPYAAIPFLFSVHAENEAGKIIHTDYLHEEADEPRPHLVDKLIEALGGEGSICMSSSYERRVLESLAKAIPEREREIAAVCDRLFDLHPVIKNSVYDPKFRGSFLIESVLPVLVPGLGYETLKFPMAKPLQSITLTRSRTLTLWNGTEYSTISGNTVNLTLLPWY